jgi:hypothetical protein
MAFYIVKLVLTAALIVIVSELAKRTTLIAGMVASLPLISFLSMIWLYIETNDAARVASLASSIFWLVLPSLALFGALPLLLQNRVPFYLSLSLSTAIMLACYVGMLIVLKKLGLHS